MKSRGRVIGCLAGVVLLLVCICLAFIAGIFGTAFTAVRSSTPYQMAMAQVAEHPQATEALGSPITAGLLATGSVNVINSGGAADLTIPVSGPRGSGSLHVLATRSNNVWQLTQLELTVNNTGQVLNLLTGQ
ncbi:MAG: hypothetical protein KJ063_10730 [Anaerolineae bacterium]|nr:hypothetical protein [Anaerolineae bacterium]